LNAHKNGVEIALKAGAWVNLEAEKEGPKEARPPNKIMGSFRGAQPPL